MRTASRAPSGFHTLDADARTVLDVLALDNDEQIR